MTDPKNSIRIFCSKSFTDKRNI